MKRKRIIFAIIAVTAAIVALSIWPERELSKRLICGSQMKHIGASAKLYTTGAMGEMAVQQLVNSGLLTQETLTCPSSGLQHGNYVMVELLLTKREIDDRTVIMYEPKSNHRDGGNFVFADGHVAFRRGEQYDLLASKPTSWWEITPKDE